MKHIEEIDSGDCFTYQGIPYIATFDFSNDNKRLCVNLKDGSLRWLDQNQIVDCESIYILDKDNNIISIRDHKHDTKNS